MITVEVVHVTNGNCHVYGPALLDRAINFLFNYDIEGDPEYLWHELSYEMRNTPANKLMLVAVDTETNEVVGHLIAEFQMFSGICSTMITQLEFQAGTQEERAAVFEKNWPVVEAWARAKGSKKIKCWAANLKVASLFKKFGFKAKDYVLMEQDLPAEEE